MKSLFFSSFSDFQSDFFGCSDLIRASIDPSDTRRYNTDSLWSYEVGLKRAWPSQKITLNTAIFHVDWSEIQQLNRLECGFEFISNAGKAQSQGVELELESSLSDRAHLSFAAGYTNAEITDNGGLSSIREGDKIQGVPNWTSSLSLDYNVARWHEWQLNLRVDANYYGRSFSANNETSYATQRLRDAWSAFNTKLQAQNGRYTFSLFAENITDERANLADNRSIGAETPGRPRLVTNRPRTIGIALRTAL